MADTSNTVNVRINVPAVDLSGIDALIRRGDALSASLTDLRQNMRDTGKQLSALPTAPGAAVPARPGVVPPAPGTQQTVATLQSQLHDLQTRQAQIDQATAPQIFREIDRKRRELEHQLQRLTVDDQTRQRQDAAESRRQVLPAAPVIPGVPATLPPALARVTGRRPPVPMPTVPTAPAPAGAPQAAAPAAPTAPTAPTAPLSQRDLWQHRMQLAATQHRLATVQAQRARVTTGPRADRLQREEDALQARAQRLTETIQTGQAVPAGPEEAGEDGGGGRPPRAPRPPRPPQPEPGSQVLGLARRGAGFLSSAFLGGTIGGLAAQSIGMLATPLIDRVRVAMERYEQRVRGVGQLSQQLILSYDQINERLNTMRDNYSLLASEGLEVMQGITRTVVTTPGAERGAARFARAFGVAPGVAGEMQGRFERLIAPYGPETRTPLARIAGAMVRERPGIPEISDLQFVEQALGIAGTGGYAVPQLSGDFVGRMTDFLGSLGARFPGQQANVYQQFAQGLSAPTAEPMQALRLRAVSRLADRLPGGILTVGKGKDAERIDLRTMEGIQQALELAPQSPEVMEAMAREAQEAGGGYGELERYMFRGIVTPGMGVTVGNRIYRRRGELGRTGFEALARPLPGAPKVEEEVDLRIKGTEPLYQKLIETNAALEKQLEDIGKKFVEGKLAVEKWTAELLAYLKDTNKDAQAYRERVDKEQLEGLQELRQHAKDGSLTLKEFFDFVFTVMGQQALVEGTTPRILGGGGQPPPSNTTPQKAQ